MLFTHSWFAAHLFGMYSQVSGTQAASLPRQMVPLGQVIVGHTAWQVPSRQVCVLPMLSG